MTLIGREGVIRRLTTRHPDQVFGRYAGFISRAIALLIDQAIIGITVAIMFVIVRSVLSIGGMQLEQCTAWVPMDSVSDIFDNVCRAVRGTTFFVSIVFGPIYYILLWSFGGQTLGMSVTGVRVVQANGTSLPIGRSIRRIFGFVLCILTLGIGFLSVNWDTRRQGWHDKIANSYVVYSWKPTPVPPMKSPLPPIPVMDEDVG